MDTLADVLQRDGRELVKSGHIELLGILRGLESDGFSAIQWGLIRELRGDILSIQGRWDEAEEEYAAAIQLFQEAPKEERHLLDYSPLELMCDKARCYG